MTIKEAQMVLMRCAQNDVTGSGQGYRSTTDEWRDQVKAAWAVVFKHVYGYQPGHNDKFNWGMA
jgi:hypothetical protein